MTKPLSHKLALITGATSGLGEALSRKLAEQGIDLILCGRDETKLRSLDGDLANSVNVQTVKADLAFKEERNKVIDAIQTHIPTLVINCAGYGLYGDVISHETQKTLDLFEVNGSAVLELTIVAAKAMANNRVHGVIMNISSASAFTIFPGYAVYSASKKFVNHFSESLDFEMKSRGIRVLTACPGMIATSFRSRAIGKPAKYSPYSMTADEAAKEVIKQIESGRRLNIFGKRYKIAAFIIKYFLPKALVANFLYRYMKKNIIPTENDAIDRPG